MNSIVLALFSALLLFVHLPAAGWWQRRMLRGVDEPTRIAIRRDVRGHWIRLLIAQAVAGIGAGAYLALSPDAIQNGHMQPAAVRLAALGFHAIWWPFVFPLILRLDKSLRAHGVLAPLDRAGPVRSASLRPRRVSDYLPRWSTPFEVALAIVAVTAIGARVLSAPELNSRLLWSAGMFALWALAVMLAYAFWIRMEVRQPYSPLHATASENEVDSYRRFRIRMIFALQIAMALTFFAAAAMVIEVAHGTFSGAMVGLIGGTAGALIGIGGGIFGTMASIRAAKLQRTKRFREQ